MGNQLELSGRLPIFILTAMKTFSIRFGQAAGPWPRRLDPYRRYLTEKEKEQKRLCLVCLVCLVVLYFNVKNCFSINYIITTTRQDKTLQDRARQNTPQTRQVTKNALLRLLSCSYPRFVLFTPPFCLVRQILSCKSEALNFTNSLFFIVLNIFLLLQDKQDKQDSEKYPLGICL